MTCDRTHYVKT